MASEVTGQVKRVEVFNNNANRPADDGGTNILLVGSDDRTGLTPKERRKLKVGQDDYGRHTDTIMIAHIADNGAVDVVSIPRDSYAEIPAYTTSSGTTIPSSKQKINAAYSIGGPTLTVETVENATGVHIDHFAEINFLGFVDVVQAMGGVPVCLKQPIVDEKSGLNLPAGEQTLDGKQALGFVRARYFDPSADIGRMKRQQNFLSSMFKQAFSAGVILNPPRLISFLNATASSITVDEQFDSAEMWSLMGKLRALSPSQLSFQTVPLGDDLNLPGVGSVVEWDQAKAQALFAQMKTGDPLGAPAKAAATNAPTVEKAPADISVQVFNGSTVSGLGTKAAGDLRDAGYSISGAVTNSTTRVGDQTLVEYDPRYDTSLETLKQALPDAQFKAVNNLGHTFRIIVGSNWSKVNPVNVSSASSSSAPVSGGSAPTDRPQTAADNVCS